MFESPISKRTLFFASVFSMFVIFSLFLKSALKSETTIVFCDVGQGDAAYIRIKNRVDLVIDAGPDRKILECLGKYMPFYDRTIELAIISHPQKDHFGGFLYLLDRYNIKNFWMGQIYNSAESFQMLLKKIRAKQIKIDFPLAGTRMNIADAEIFFYWPTEEFLLKESVTDLKSDETFKVSGLDPNNFSSIFSFEDGGLPHGRQAFKALFTGDAPPQILNRLLQQSEIKSDILKIPHHGSKNGLTVEFLKLADPTYGVISVGKNNSYGHPAKEVLDMLEAQNVIIRRTDLEGDIVFKIENGKMRMEK